MSKMNCARCGATRDWPKDFPHRIYAFCTQCVHEEAAAQQLGAMQMKRSFSRAGKALLIAGSLLVIWYLWSHP
jgi:hypothetical protein